LIEHGFVQENPMSTVAHFSLTEYDRMIAAGVFDERERRRIELIFGEVRDMNPIGSQHETIVDRLTEWSFGVLPKGSVWVRVQNSIGLPGWSSAPEPDLVWVARRDYSLSRPTADDVFLVIEVAESSLAFDLGEKADLYASAGIPDYWVVDVLGQSIRVCREPSPEGYRDICSHANDDEIRPLRMPEICLKPALLW
jgi:Uma2 family endonuclease